MLRKTISSGICMASTLISAFVCSARPKKQYPGTGTCLQYVHVLIRITQQASDAYRYMRIACLHS